VKYGYFGKFLACPGYPECKNTKPIVQETPGECPLCGGKVLQKKSKNNRKYFACENHPKNCNFMTWDTPTAEHCTGCGKTLFKGRGGALHCLNEACEHAVKQERTAKPVAKAPERAVAKTATGAAATAKKPAAKKSTAKKPAAKKPATKKPATKKSTASKGKGTAG